MFNPLTFMGIVSIQKQPGSVDLGALLVNRLPNSNIYRVTDKVLKVTVFEGKLGATRKFLKDRGLKL